MRCPPQGYEHIDVPASFTGPDLQALEVAAARDPRLRQAKDHAKDGRITQYLAGLPSLIERYLTAPAAARAVVDAALDIRRAGHGQAIPRALLEAAVPWYLADDEWNALPDGWLKAALDYAVAPCRGLPGPLTPVRPRSIGAQTGAPDYRVADLLEQRDLGERMVAATPPGLWAALARHAAPQDRKGVAEQAHRRGLYRDAIQQYVLAGDLYSMEQVALLLTHMNRLGEAREWLRAFAAAGSATAAHAVTLLPLEEPLRRRHESDHVRWGPGFASAQRQLLKWISTRSDAQLMHQFQTQRLLYLAQGGDIQKVEQLNELFKRTSVAPSNPSPTAMLLELQGQYEEAIAWFRKAAMTGSPQAIDKVAELLIRTGRHDEAEALGRYGMAPNGDTAKPWYLSELAHPAV
ncbi:hypothetical protein [Streptomyces mirabilis]|uniref:hypothetical protein n=1 Tax=Streptomyces mirabilis TaxID=68239 RepID=UPI0033181BCD